MAYARIIYDFCRSHAKFLPQKDFIMAKDFQTSFTTEQTVYIPLKNIWSPKLKARAWINPERVKEIAISASAHGILQPILVSPLKNGNYELVYGQHRIEALKYIKEHNLDVTYNGHFPLDAIKAEVKKLSPSERLEIALLENENREDQNPIDKTLGILNLIKLELDCDETYAKSCLWQLFEEKDTLPPKNNLNKPVLEAKTGFRKKIFGQKLPTAHTEATAAILERFNIEAPSFCTAYLPLLNLHPDVIEAIQLGKIAYSKGAVINQVQDDNYRKALMKATQERNISREALQKMKRIKDTQQGLALLARIQKENLKNKEIEAIVHEYMPQKEINVVKNEYTKAISLLKKNNDIWSDRKKLKRLERIVAEIKELAVT